MYGKMVTLFDASDFPRMSRVLLVLSLACLWMPSAKASFISIETKAKTEIKGDTLGVRVDVMNNGDEPAYQVNISAEVNGKVFSGAPKDALPPKGTGYMSNFQIPVTVQKPGKYPVVVYVDYADVNKYPFSAVSVLFYDWKEEVSPQMGGQVTAPPLGVGGTGVVQVGVKNMDVAEKEIKVRLVLPSEFSSPTPEKVVKVSGRGMQTVAFDIKNNSALQGSTYPIHALLQHEDTKHYAVVVAGTIKIGQQQAAKPDEKSFKDKAMEYKNVLIGIVVLLLLVVVVVSFTKRQRK